MDIKALVKRCKFLVVILLIPFELILAQPKEKPNKCIMVFGSHADDVEEIAGGTFAKYIAEGYQGIYVCVMNNTSGNELGKVPGNYDFRRGKMTEELTGSSKMFQVGALETMQIRREEAKAAAKDFGATPVFLDFKEPEIWLGRKLIIYGTQEFIDYDPPGRKQVALATRYSEDVNFVVDLLKKYKPEITIIHTMGGEKLDHGESGYLVYLAYKKAMSQHVPLGKLWMPVYGWLADALAQKNGRGKPDVVIDVSKYASIKVKAWNEHVSQNGGDVERDFLPRHPELSNKVEKFITVIDNSK